MKIVQVLKESVSQRLATCESCDQYKPDSKTCAKCGCYMPAKVYLISASCPLGKWGVPSIENIRQQMAELRQNERLQKLKK